MTISSALDTWRTTRAADLDRMEAVHREVTGESRGRRWDSEHLNCAIITRLSSEFQGFARDLLTDSADHIVSQSGISDPKILSVMRGSFLYGAQLTKGNPTWVALSGDFGQLGINLKSSIDRRYPVRGKQWRTKLDRLMLARNAIAHADDAKLMQCRANGDLTLRRAREWRSFLGGLCTGMDAVVGAHLKAMTGSDPW